MTKYGINYACGQFREKTGTKTSIAVDVMNGKSTLVKIIHVTIITGLHLALTHKGVHGYNEI